MVSAAISNVDTSGEGTAIEVGGKLIVVESDGTVIISGNDAASGPAPSETAEVEYLTGEWPEQPASQPGQRLQQHLHGWAPHPHRCLPSRRQPGGGQRGGSAERLGRP